MLTRKFQQTVECHLMFHTWVMSVWSINVVISSISYLQASSQSQDVFLNLLNASHTGLKTQVTPELVLKLPICVAFYRSVTWSIQQSVVCCQLGSAVGDRGHTCQHTGGLYLCSPLHLLTGAQLFLHCGTDLASFKLQLTTTHVCLQSELDTKHVNTI